MDNDHCHHSVLCYGWLCRNVLLLFRQYFFGEQRINGINCSGKTSEEAEQAVAKKAEDYLLEVKARNLKSQSINGKLIGYRMFRMAVFPISG